MFVWKQKKKILFHFPFLQKPEKTPLKSLNLTNSIVIKFGFGMNKINLFRFGLLEIKLKFMNG